MGTSLEDREENGPVRVVLDHENLSLLHRRTVCVLLSRASLLN
jgi:hypothetical protein